MGDKRGQLTIFIIIGIVILFGVFVVLFVNQQAKKLAPAPEVEQVPQDIEPVRQFMQGCLDQSLKDALVAVGLNGGNVQSTRQYVDLPYAFTFSSTGRRNIMPNIDGVKSQLNDFIIGEIEYCSDNFIKFIEQGYDIKAGSATTDISFGNRETTVRLNYPLTITKDGTESKISSFIGRAPVRFGYVYDVAYNISELSASNGGRVDLSHLNSIQFLNITVASNLEGQNVYIIRDEQSLIENEPYTFMMAVEE